MRALAGPLDEGAVDRFAGLDALEFHAVAEPPGGEHGTAGSRVFRTPARISMSVPSCLPQALRLDQAPEDSLRRPDRAGTVPLRRLIGTGHNA
jgi:hypothetical protein